MVYVTVTSATSDVMLQPKELSFSQVGSVQSDCFWGFSAISDACFILHILMFQLSCLLLSPQHLFNNNSLIPKNLLPVKRQVSCYLCKCVHRVYEHTRHLEQGVM